MNLPTNYNINDYWQMHPESRENIRQRAQPVEQQEDPDEQCECGMFMDAIREFCGDDLDGHIQDCRKCGSQTMHIGDDQGSCVNCGHYYNVDAEGNVYEGNHKTGEPEKKVVNRDRQWQRAYEQA